MTCNARIEVGGETLTCADPAGHYSRMHTSGTVQWTDDAPGAVPHEEPRPRYEAVAAGSFWDVLSVDGDLAAAFWMGCHPDPEAAAKREAARLNGEACELVDVGGLLEEQAVMHRKLADAEAEVARFHADWQQAIVAQQEACRALDKHRAEADRYRFALQGI